MRINPLALLWLLVIIGLSTAAYFSHPKIDTNMMSLLPSSQQKPIVKEAAEQVGQQFSQRLLILVSAKNKQLRRQTIDHLAKEISSLKQVGSVIDHIDNNTIQKIQKSLFPYRYSLLSNNVVTDIIHGQTDKVKQQALARIMNPVSFGNNDLVADPFGLMSAWLQKQPLTIDIGLDQGYLRLNRSPSTYLLIVNLSSNAFSLNTQKAVLGAYYNLIPELANKGVTIQTSGLLIHAYAGAKQAQHEITTIGLGSLIGIILIMLWVFKSIRALVLLLLPVFVGLIVSTALSFLVFGRIHIVTFAFGAGLIGVAIDYALHFLCERQSRQDAIKHILPGLLLGLISSVLAYAAQAIAPFPGLRQMAFFSVVGLISAWLTVVLWLPSLISSKQKPVSPLVNKLLLWQSLLPNTSKQPRIIISILLITTVLAAVTLYHGKYVDNIRLLNTSPPALLAQEKNVQKLLGYKSSTEFFLLPCKHLQSCLQQEEKLKPILTSWVKAKKVTQYQLVSDSIPSLKKQQENNVLTTKLYHDELQSLFSTLHLPNDVFKAAMNDFNQGKNKYLLPHNEQSSLFSNTKNQIISTANSKATIIRFSPTLLFSSNDINQLKQISPDIILVDQIGTISNLLKTYRQQISTWVIFAYVFVFFILVWRYKFKVWRIVLPPLLASIYTIAILLLFLPGINLFNMMALFLVLGIGIDMGIFLAETQQAIQTWLAVTLSIITSLLSFGLLSFSHTPVLMNFGLTVLIGLSLTWVLATLLQPQRINIETP